MSLISRRSFLAASAGAASLPMLGSQSSGAETDVAVIGAGAAGIARRLRELRAAGIGHAIVDAVTDADLHAIAEAAGA